MKNIYLLFIFAVASMLISALFATPSLAKQNDTNVLLAQFCHRGINVRQYLVSEKYDGMQGVWEAAIFTHAQGV